MLLTGFEASRPTYELSQARSLEWLTAAHTEAEATRAALGTAEKAEFAARIGRLIHRGACGPDSIARRGHSVADVELGGWDGNEIYDVRRDPHGAGTAARSRLFGELVGAYFERDLRERPRTRRSDPRDVHRLRRPRAGRSSSSHGAAGRRASRTRITWAATRRSRRCAWPPGSQRWARAHRRRAHRAVLAASRSRRSPHRAARRAEPVRRWPHPLLARRRQARHGLALLAIHERSSPTRPDRCAGSPAITACT